MRHRGQVVHPLVGVPTDRRLHDCLTHMSAYSADQLDSGPELQNITLLEDTHSFYEYHQSVTVYFEES